VDPGYTVKIFPVHGEFTKGLKTFRGTYRLNFESARILDYGKKSVTGKMWIKRARDFPNL
jgi:hypothetical protein